MRSIIINTRWKAEQINATTFEIKMPDSSDGHPVISKEFISMAQLSDAEINKAEYAALKAVAILD
jgi:hypothetical protein